MNYRRLNANSAQEFWIRLLLITPIVIVTIFILSRIHAFSVWFPEKQENYQSLNTSDPDAEWDWRNDSTEFDFATWNLTEEEVLSWFNRNSTRRKREVKTYLTEPFHNAFIAMHFQAAKKLNLSKCWICTHAPTTHKTIPLLGIPSTLEEIEQEAHFSNVSEKNERRQVSLLLASSVPLKNPVVCVNFTRPEALASGGSPKNIGVTDCRSAPLRYWFKDRVLYWNNDTYDELYALTYRNGSKMNNYRLNTCLVGYNFQKACSTPPGFYFICGKKAYNWIPVNARGVCYFGKVVPATWYVHDDDFIKSQFSKIPDHILNKRAAIFNPIDHNILDPIPTETDRELMHRPAESREIKPLFDIPWVNRCCIKKAFSFIIDLADLMDNVTALYDRNFVLVATEMKMFKLELLQHRLVLDYLTASQGGMCAIVGTACCNYMSNNTNIEDAIISHVEKVRGLKQEFRTKHTEKAFINLSWLDWLNPTNWFSGLGEWFSGIVHGFMYLIILVIGLCFVFKLIFMIFKRCNRAAYTF